jgi:hypothetical protein
MVAEATKTVFVTVTAAASQTAFPARTPEEQKKFNKSKSIAQWVAIAIFASYILFTLCLLSIWIHRRIKHRHDKPIAYGLLPEAGQSRGSFLLPGKRGVRRDTGGSNFSNYSVISIEEQERRTRSMFYEGPGTPMAERQYSPPETSSRPRSSSRHDRRYSSSQTNLIRLQSPGDSTPPLPSVSAVYVAPAIPAKIPLDAGPERPRTGRSRSSSQSTARYYVPDSPPEPMPTLPTIAMRPTGGRSAEWQPVPL